MPGTWSSSSSTKPASPSPSPPPIPGAAAGSVPSSPTSPEPARERARRPGRLGHHPLTWWAAPHPWKSADLLGFLQHTLPGDGARPRAVVLDNASMHTSHTIQTAHDALQKQGIRLWYLLPGSPGQTCTFTFVHAIGLGHRPAHQVGFRRGPARPDGHALPTGRDGGPNTTVVSHGACWDRASRHGPGRFHVCPRVPVRPR